MPSKRILAGAALGLMMTGCCLISNGTYQEVKFNTDPRGAEVKVNGQFLGTTWVELSVPLPRKEVKVTFEKAGYQTEERVLKCRTNSKFYWSLVMGVLAGGIDWITGAWREFETDTVPIVVLKPIKGKPVELEVSITSNPPGADVWIDKLRLGKTNRDKPLKVKLTWNPGENDKNVEFRMQDYETKTYTLSRWMSSLLGNLDPKPVDLAADFASNPSGADVAVDGKALGQTPMRWPFQWFPGSPPREAVFTKAGYLTRKVKFTKDDPPQPITLEEEKRTKSLKVEVDPAGVDIEVEDKFLGSGVTAIEFVWSVSSTSHKITFSLPGFRTRQETITEDKLRSPLKIRLEPLLPKLP